MEDVLLAAMELTTILNQCYPQPGFVYQKTRFRADKKAIEVPGNLGTSNAILPCSTLAPAHRTC